MTNLTRARTRSFIRVRNSWFALFELTNHDTTLRTILHILIDQFKQFQPRISNSELNKIKIGSYSCVDKQ